MKLFGTTFFFLSCLKNDFMRYRAFDWPATLLHRIKQWRQKCGRLSFSIPNIITLFCDFITFLSIFSACVMFLPQVL